jgi:hypothetical protein
MAHRVWMNSAKGTQWFILEGLRRYGVELSYDEILEVLG